MRLREFKQSVILPAPLEEVWDFFSQPANLPEITPPEMGLKMLGGGASGEMYAGQLLWYRVHLLPFLYRTWVTEIKQVVPYQFFVDEQRFGPFKFWLHKHSFREAGPGATEVTDHIIYALPFWPFGELAHPWFVEPMNRKMFQHRQAKLEQRFGTGPVAS